MMGSMSENSWSFRGLQNSLSILAGCFSDRIKLIKSFSLLFLLLFIANESFAQSQLIVAPTRVVFSDKIRSSQVTIVNAGDEAGTFRISLVNKRMTIDGNFEDVKKANPGEQFADKMIRFSPRQVVLKPGQSQVVRLGLRKPANLDAGEYRSHMLFKAIPKDVSKDIKPSKESEKINIRLSAIIAISIPVIVRHGKTDASVSFTSASYHKRLPKEDYPHLMLNLQRTGDQSVYGDFLAEFVDSSGAKKVVAQVKGVAIYTPGKERRVRLPLTLSQGLDLVNGKIQVFYRSPADQGGKVMAQTQVIIP